jgi:hypothetical protein
MGLAALDPIFNVWRQACVYKGMIFACHERKSFIRKLWYIRIYILINVVLQSIS